MNLTNYLGKQAKYNNKTYEVVASCFESKELCLEDDESVLWVKYDECEILGE